MTYVCRWARCFHQAPYNDVFYEVRLWRQPPWQLPYLLSDYKRPSTQRAIPSKQHLSSLFNYPFYTQPQTQSLPSCLETQTLVTVASTRLATRGTLPSLRTPKSGSTKELRTPISAWIPVREITQEHSTSNTNSIAEDERSIANRLAAEEVCWYNQSSSEQQLSSNSKEMSPKMTSRHNG